MSEGPRVHRPELCGVCPLCAAARHLEVHRPEVAAHLAEAAHHLAAALRVLLDPPADATPGAAPTTAPTTGAEAGAEDGGGGSASDAGEVPADGALQRIDLDEQCDEQ